MMERKSSVPNKSMNKNYNQFDQQASPKFVNKNKASPAMQSPRTTPFFLLISLLDGYSFANVHVKGIVVFNIKKKRKKKEKKRKKKNKQKNCDLDINHRPMKHEPVQDMFILSICEKLYLNQSKDEKARTMKKSCLLTAL